MDRHGDLIILDENEKAVRPNYENGDHGSPFCSRDDCPSFDGKRCSIMGYCPTYLCEPLIEYTRKKGQKCLIQTLRKKIDDLEHKFRRVTQKSFYSWGK